MDHLETEARNPASTNLDELTTLELVRLMNAEDAKVASAVASQAEAIARAIEVIAERLGAGGRLVYAGAGTSGRLGVLDATECPPTFNAPPGQVVGIIAGGPPALTRAVEGAEDHPEFAERDLAELRFSSGDVLVGVATSGRTPYVLGAVQYARRLGAFTIGLSCNSDSELIPHVDLAITPVVGPEVLSGSTRLKAGTATKLVLNLLSTGAMVRLGKVFGNLMVDLRATNTKLVARTNRIVRQLTGLSKEHAGALLERCGQDLKTALVAHLAGVEPEEAKARLQTAGGQVRVAFGGVAHPDVLRRPWRDSTQFGVSQGVLPETTSVEAAEGMLVLGIDGGGTHTVALLAQLQAGNSEKWISLGRGESGPSNLQAVGLEAACRALDEAVERAFRAAGLPRRAVAAACLGLAGAGRHEDQERIRAWALRAGLAATAEVTADAPLLLAAGTPHGWGIALIAGTGSMAFGRSPSGQTARAGGWGYLLGDEGSGYALALAALRAVARMADQRGPATSLMDALLSRLGLKQPQELIAAIYRGGMDRPAIPSLAPVVLEAADSGDEVARAIVQKGAEQLALTVAAVARQLKLDSPVPLALAGGLLLASASYRQRLLQALADAHLRVEPVTLVPEPAEGAVRIASLAATQALASRPPSPPGHP
jgi:N-acetylmuramic acid 6-phosphate etherase